MTEGYSLLSVLIFIIIAFGVTLSVFHFPRPEGYFQSYRAFLSAQCPGVHGLSLQPQRPCGPARAGIHAGRPRSARERWGAGGVDEILQRRLGRAWTGRQGIDDPPY